MKNEKQFIEQFLKLLGVETFNLLSLKYEKAKNEISGKATINGVEFSLHGGPQHADDFINITVPSFQLNGLKKEIIDAIEKAMAGGFAIQVSVFMPSYESAAYWRRDFNYYLDIVIYKEEQMDNLEWAMVLSLPIGEAAQVTSNYADAGVTDWRDRDPHHPDCLYPD